MLQNLVTVAAVNDFLLYSKKLNLAYSAINAVYAEKVKAIYQRQFDVEDVDGFSHVHVNAAHYHMANLLVLMFYRDFTSGEYSFTYLVEFYKVKELIECFRCLEIDLIGLFKAVEIDICAILDQCGQGIESIEIETSFQVEKAFCVTVEETSTTGEPVDIAVLLQEPDGCTILITNNLINNGC